MPDATSKAYQDALRDRRLSCYYPPKDDPDAKGDYDAAWFDRPVIGRPAIGRPRKEETTSRPRVSETKNKNEDAIVKN